MLRLTAADLVDQHRLCTPDRGRRLEKPDLALRFVRIRKAHEVVEGDEARVVVAMFEPERFAEGVKQERFTRPALPDQQDRILRHERRKQNGLLLLEAIGTKSS